MTLTHLDYFVVLAQECNFTRAATKLCITQQSLSASIAALEQELGCKLVVRRTPLELTYAGTVFLRHAQKIRQDMEALNREFCDISENQRGVLRIGITFSRSQVLMPRLIKQFQQEFPNIEIALAESTNKALHQLLLNGEIDLAIANFPDNLQGVALEPFYTEEVLLLLSNELLAQLAPATPERIAAALAKDDLSPLQNCPFVLGNSQDIAGRVSQRLMEQANFHPIVKARSNNMETLLAMCLQGTGACFCSQTLADGTLTPKQLESLTRFPLGPHAQTPIRFGYRKATYQWSIIAEFIRLARASL